MLLYCNENGGVINIDEPELTYQELKLASPAPLCGVCEGHTPAVSLAHVGEEPTTVQPVGGNVVPSNDSVYVV